MATKVKKFYKGLLEKDEITTMEYRDFVRELHKKQKIKRQQPEREQCYALVEWLRLQKFDNKPIMFFHLKNENTIKNPAYFTMIKKMGVNPGCPDYLILLDSVIFIEMKAAKGKVSLDQILAIEKINSIQNATAVVCYSAIEAINYITRIKTIAEKKI